MECLRKAGQPTARGVATRSRGKEFLHKWGEVHAVFPADPASAELERPSKEIRQLASKRCPVPFPRKKKLVSGGCCTGHARDSGDAGARGPRELPDRSHGRGSSAHSASPAAPCPPLSFSGPCVQKLLLNERPPVALQGLRQRAPVQPIFAPIPLHIAARDRDHSRLCHYRRR